MQDDPIFKIRAEKVRFEEILNNNSGLDGKFTENTLEDEVKNYHAKISESDSINFDKTEKKVRKFSATLTKYLYSQGWRKVF